MTKHPLKIALIYELRSAYHAIGYSESECQRLEVGEAAEDIAAALTHLGHNVTLVPDIRSLMERLVLGEGDGWDLAFNTTEGLHGLAREAQVPALLEAYQIPFTFSDAATMALCLDKGRTKMVLEHYGVPTAPFAIIRTDTHQGEPSSLTWEGIQVIIQSSKHARSLSCYPLFAKPLAEGSSKGIMATNKIGNVEDICHVVNSMWSRCPSSQAILIESFLSGREFTVGVVGTGKDAWVIGATEIIWRGSVSGKAGNGSGAPVHFTTEKSKTCDDWDGIAAEVKAERTDPEVELACQVALKAWNVLQCRDAGRIDIRLDHSSGVPVANVMEVNPLAGLRPKWSQLPIIAENSGISFEGLMDYIVQGASKRCPGR